MQAKAIAESNTSFAGSTRRVAAIAVITALAVLFVVTLNEYCRYARWPRTRDALGFLSLQPDGRSQWKSLFRRMAD
jgi:hypothetical protein